MTERLEITTETLIADALRWRVGAEQALLEEFDLPCWECAARFVETIGEGVAYSGVDPAAVARRLNELPLAPE